jgi:cell division protein FtsZ
MEPRASAQTEPYPDLLASKEEEKREDTHRLPPMTHETHAQRMTPPQPRPATAAQPAIEPILSRDDKSKKPFSFFERVTGARRAREEESPRFGQREMPGPAQAPTARITPPAPEMPTPRPKPAADPKPSNETLFREQGQDDQLEIPAFLRRQAN